MADIYDRTTFAPTIISFACCLNNSSPLVAAEVQPSKDHLACLDGIRFLSMTWVMLGHWFATFEGQFKVTNMFELLRLTQANGWFQAIDNAFVSVDTFFLLSACLVSYLTLKELDKHKGKINVPSFYIHRYFRLLVRHYHQCY